MKTTFKHTAPNGTTYKRQSARPYTHVVLARANIAKSVAYIEQFRDATNTSVARSVGEYFDRYTLAQQVGDGGRVPYLRGQGGFGRPEGQGVDKYMLESAAEFFAKHGTLRATAIARAVDRQDAETTKRVREAQEQSADWYVLSWHQGEKNALKAASSAAGVRDTKVEIVNGGVQS